MTARAQVVIRTAVLRLAIAVMLLVPAGAAAHGRTSLDADELVVLFPTAARLDGDEWVVPLHGWIFETGGTLSRSPSFEALRAAVGVRGVDGERVARLEQRARFLLADNESLEVIPLRIAGRAVTPGPSGANGHFRGTDRVGAAEAAGAVALPGWLPVLVVTPEGDPRRFEGRALLVPPRGLSVISDIDDTVRISHVRDLPALLRGTFIEELAAVPGMAAAYQSWASQGALFHYVSQSPWQLYPVLAEWLERDGFPLGTWHLRGLRFDPRNPVQSLAGEPGAKQASIEALLRDYPERRFILVGDSGERDPEIYGAVARAAPDAVLHVFIRDVTGEGPDSARYAESFRDVPRTRWTVFSDPAVLSAFTLPPAMLHP